MRPIFKLITPQLSEIIAYSTAALVILLLENYYRIKLLLDSSAGTVYTGDPRYDNILTRLITDFQDKLSASLMDFMVWMLIGSIAFGVVSGFIALYKTTNKDMKLLSFYKSSKYYRYNAFMTLTKAAIRFSAVMFVLIWVIYALVEINNFVSNNFFTDISNLSYPFSWIWIILDIIILAASLYVVAIALRLVILRVRVFSKQGIDT